MKKSLPAIRRDLRFTPHLQHNELWYAVEDHANGRFMRMGWQEYAAAMQFDGVKDVQEIIAAASQMDETFKLTETDIEQLYVWLSRVNFLVNPQGNSVRRPAPELLSSRSIWDPLGARFALIKGLHVEQVARMLQPLTSLPSAIGVGLLAIAAAITVIASPGEFFESTSKLFVPEGRVWWIVAWLFLKVVHELGHAVTAVRAGSPIRSAGISFFFFAPVPYIDVSDLWSISNRWQRILCSAGGMLFEIAVASIAVFVAFLADNESLRYLACAIATTGTITTLAFNANPFVRFDGYYILADALQKSNLWSDGQNALKSFVHGLLHPFAKPTTPFRPALLAFGLICAFNRFLMLLGIVLWSLIVWQGYGLLIIAWAAYAWFLSPWIKSRKAAAMAPPTQTQTSAVAWWSKWWQPLTVTALITIALLVPSPVQPSVPGIVAFHEPTIVRSQSEGTLTAVHVDELDQVKVGDLIAEFENPQLLETLALKQLEVAAAEETIAIMRARGELAVLQGEQAKLFALREQVTQLEKDARELVVRAASSGTILANDLKRQIGRNFKPGEPLTIISKPDELEIKLSASQQDHQALKNFKGREIKITSFGNGKFSGIIDDIDWRGSDLLDEPALAATYGGPITVELASKDTDKGGFKLPSPRFEVHVKMSPDNAKKVVPGQLAWARIPDSSTSLLGLFQRWLKKKWEATKLENNAT
ncbi:MAG: efflux RND transporter periplasmic adaptor subunit [Pirellulaceae bacterium]|nr:efflux RND transporter periplasmic adaptor subunit [Pirellulaceae bacterium]